MRVLEKGIREQKKQKEPCETVRMHCSFLFVGTAEGALCRIFLVVDFAVTYTQPHSLPCHRQTPALWACANTHILTYVYIKVRIYIEE